MIRKIILLSLWTISLFAMQIDVPTLETIVQNDQQAYKERLILAKYYEQEGYDKKAVSLAKEVLKIKPNDKYAKAILKDIEKREQARIIFRDASITLPINKKAVQKKLQTYYDSNKYQLYSNLYQALVYSGVKLDDSFHIKAAYIYLWDGQYEEAKKSLSHLKQKNNIDEAKIKAEICYYQGHYNCAIHYYEELYNSSYKLDYAIKLINSYIYVGKTARAQRLYNFVIRRYPNSKDLQKIGRSLSKGQEKYLNKKRDAYEANPNEQTLESYIAALSSVGKTQKILELLKEYNSIKPTPKSLLLEAKYLTWTDHSSDALEVLRSKALSSDFGAKLMLGKLYSWDQKFDEAKEYLDEVITRSGDKSLIYEAKKARAFIYMWEKKKKRAKRAFLKLQRENPQDKEVQEALMELNNNYAGLIRIYKERVSKHGRAEDIKRLADLYVGNKEPSKAIAYFKRYLVKNPDDLEVMKNLALLLIDNKEYYEGFGYLEYYTAQKHDVKSMLLLAKYYYWSGFSKEALDVLNKLLEKEPQNRKALELKAKILKISPRFTTSNSGATIGVYFDELGKKQLALADALYFNSHYEASLMYYENYLKNNPTDYKARLRYAFALEYARWNGKAEGEFALMRWIDNSDEIRYHYAYNMMKNCKFKEAKKELIALKKSVYKKISPNLKRFLDEWKSDWESQNYERYVQNYDKSFANNQKWAYRKQQLFSTLKYISIGIYDPVYKQLENGHYKIRFFQEYATNKRNDKGYKTLEVACTKSQRECKIVKENWKAAKYHKDYLLEPYIDNALKELKRLESSSKPLACKQSRYSRKKKTLLCLNQQNIVISI